MVSSDDRGLECPPRRVGARGVDMTGSAPPKAGPRLAAVPLLSLVLHGVAAVALVVEPSAWRWVMGAIVANHLALAALSLTPRGQWLGPNLWRLPEATARRNAVAITIDDGPDPEVTPRVLDILDAHAAQATFFCIARNVVEHPELARDIVRRGHAIENHSERHRWYFALMGIGGFTRELDRAQRSIAAVTASAPQFFRAPAGFRSPFLDPALRRTGLILVSWTRRGFDTVNRDPDAVLRRLLHRLRAGDILLLHDGHAARTAAGTPVIVEVLPRLLTAIREAGLSTVTLRSADL